MSTSNQILVVDDDFATLDFLRSILELSEGEFKVLGVPSAEEMIRILTQDNETVVRTARRILPAAQSENDESTASLIADRMVIHEKVAWMIRSSL